MSAVSGSLRGCGFHQASYKSQLATRWLYIDPMSKLAEASLSTGERAWLAQRREIESFFIAEVDRDKIAVGGSG